MNSIIGKKLRLLRKQKGFTQEQVADYLYISQSAYARIENGQSQSWANLLKSICNIFEIKPTDLLESDSIVIKQNQQDRQSNNTHIINQLLKKLIDQYEKRIELLENELAKLKNN